MDRLICDKTEICGDPDCHHHGEHDRNGECHVAGCLAGGMLEDAQCVPAVSECAGTLSAQKQIVANTAARGYRDGWTAEQFAARQVCKLQEELGEMACSFIMPKVGLYHFDTMIEDLGQEAKDIFDEPTSWDEPCVFGDLGDAKKELADLQVVVFNLAETLAEITGEPFDVVVAALKKSKVDIGRGVR